MSNMLRKIGQTLRDAYIKIGYPLLPITKFSRIPLKWYYHQSPLLRHDNDFYLKPYLLHHCHSILNAGHHPHDFMIYGNSLHFRSFGSMMSYQAYYVGEVEHHLIQYLVSQLHPGVVMLDVGAHHGAHTIIAAHEIRKRGWDGVIHSFEPDPRNFELLKHNVMQNNLGDYVRLYNKAVGENSEYQELVIGSDNSCNFLKSVVTEDMMQSAVLKDSSLERVEIIRLDDLPDLGTVSLIKIDIQGAEAYALRGARELINKHRPVILVEAMKEFSYASEVLLTLESFGYLAKGIDCSGALCDPGTPQHFVSWDYAAIPN
jgi:FkbM family methyltransferase